MITTILIFLAGMVIGAASLICFAVVMLAIEHQQHTPEWER